MKRNLKITAMSVLLLTVAGQAQAATFTEVMDAGETLGTAQIMPAGGMPLDSISGALSSDLFTPGNDFADLFQIFITGTQPFSATTATSGTSFDTQLFLFDQNGIGIFGNDDVSSTIPQSTLPATFLQAGTYYLGISGFDYDPVSANGAIFPIFADSTQVVFPTGPGASASLTGFEVAATETGDYTIELTGAATAVPEPSSTLGMLVLGAWGVAYKLKHQKKVQK